MCFIIFFFVFTVSFEEIMHAKIRKEYSLRVRDNALAATVRFYSQCLKNDVMDKKYTSVLSEYKAWFCASTAIL